MDIFETKIMQAREILIEDMYRDIKAFTESLKSEKVEWRKSLKVVQLRFMKDAFIETVAFDFREDEIRKIVDTSYSFLSICWESYIEIGGTVKDAVSETVEYFVQDLYEEEKYYNNDDNEEEVDNDEKHRS